jgi:hypothetical protein
MRVIPLPVVMVAREPSGVAYSTVVSLVTTIGASPMSMVTGAVHRLRSTVPPAATAESNPEPEQYAGGDAPASADVPPTTPTTGPATRHIAADASTNICRRTLMIAPALWVAPLVSGAYVFSRPGA